MTSDADRFETYFRRLRGISLKGRLYKRLISSPLLFLCARCFGPRLLEVGSGIGAGVLGAFPNRVVGLDINPHAVNYSKTLGLRVGLIAEGTPFPSADGFYDACILDNVLEHIADSQPVLDECWRVTRPGGGLVVAVPGVRGFAADSDHKAFYGERELRQLPGRWRTDRIFAIPLLCRNEALSRHMKQYCLAGVYRK
ncbi:MAG: class I SAM-dependent methyltransferase [Terriglobales bacterium]